MKKFIPEVSAWYKDAVSGNIFEVVALDDASGCIEFQLLDGEVGEYDSATWKSLLLYPAAAPEDSRGPFELTAEDESYSDDAIVPENFSDALCEFEPELTDFGDDFSLFLPH